MSNSSVAAMRLSCEQLIANAVQENREVYLWTFTFEDAVPPKVATRLWNNFSTRIKRKYPTVGGVRVFEWHPGRVVADDGERHSHGIHVHLITDQYLEVGVLRKLAKGLFGRIHVVQAKDLTDAGKLSGYLSKYLRKGFNDRPKCLKGARLWSNWGGWEGTRCKDVEGFSAYREFLRRIRVLATKGIDTWVKVLGWSHWLMPLFDLVKSYNDAKGTKTKRRILFQFLIEAREAYMVFPPGLHNRLQLYFKTDSGLTLFFEKSNEEPLTLP